MLNRKVWCFLFIVVCLAGSVGLMAQVSPTGTLTGTVTDPSQAALVGADVKAKDNATGTEFNTKSGADGRFAINGLSPGQYTVTITMQGFKRGVFRDVKIIIGQIYDLSAHLELGDVAATVVVEAGQEVIETTTATVGTTISGQAITQLPFTSRDVLDLALLMPGAQTTGRPRQTSFMGLPKGAINITFDGINVQDSVLKSNDGFFTIIRPRVDDVEEFSISTAAQGAEQAGEGAVQIRFTSKRGGNAYHGGLFWYHRNDFLNANYYFSNLTVPQTPRQRFRLNQYGYKIGGPILKDKLFFFTDFEAYTNPGSVFRNNRTILTDAATGGQFTYPVTAVPGAPPSWVTCDSVALTCTAELLFMAAASTACAGGPCTSTVDTVVGGLLTAMNSAVSAPGVNLEANPSLFQRSLAFNNPLKSKRIFPDLRFDWNINKNHSFEFDYHYSHFTSTPDSLNGKDSTFPVAPFNTNQGSQISNRSLFVGAWRWNIGSNKSNELRFGVQSAPVVFFPDLNRSVYPQAATNLGGARIRPFLNLVTQPLTSYNTQGRNGALGQLIESFSWSRGKHNLSFGMTWTEQRYNDFFAGENVATVRLNLVPTDPARAMFNTTNLPGANTTAQTNARLANARSLYAMLAGRLGNSSSTNKAYNGDVFVNADTRQFQTGHDLLNKVTQREFGFYGTDSWRLRPSLTFTYGLRWEYQGAPVDTLNEYFRVRGGNPFGISGVGNLFKPGTLTGTTPVFDLNNGLPWWDKDMHDFAPSVGLAWQPNFDNNLWKRAFGGPGKTVIRTGYSITYTREGLNNFFTITQGNPGYSGVQTTNPVALASCPGGVCAAGTFPAGSLQLQSLNFPTLLQTPGSFRTTFPIDPVAGDPVNAHDQNLRVPRVQSWQLGIQRELTPNMVLEVRYVGNHGTGLWRQVDLNAFNIFENGFLAEFLKARDKLRINGGTSFANLNPAGGTMPLPILTGAFTGSRTGPQTDPGFSDGTNIGYLNGGLAGQFASDLAFDITSWNNIQTAGFARNFWLVNPDAQGGAFRFYNGSQSTYNALQVEFRRRPAKGLQFNGNYTWSKSLTNYFANASDSFNNFDTLHDPGRNKGLAPFDLRHAFKLQAIYELPFGTGHKWNSSYGFVNRIIEGWSLNNITRWQSGRVTRIEGNTFRDANGNITTQNGTVNQYDSGVQLIGLTPNQLQNQLSIRQVTLPATATSPARGAVFWFPDSLLAANGTANATFLRACGTPGVFCQRLFLTGPRFMRTDISIVKKTRITERTNFEFRAEFLNAFNNINFMYGGNAAATPTSRSLQNTTFGRMGDAYQDLSTTDDPGGRIIQMVLRFNF